MTIPALLVDTDPNVQPIFREVASSLGVPLATVTTMAAASRVLQENDVALVVIDADLSAGGDAAALCHEIRCTPRLRHTPIVVTSRTADETHAAFAASVGAAFLVKPFSASVFGALAQQLLDKARASRRWRGRPRVLIADDDEDLRDTLASVAVDEGWDPMCVADGEEALMLCGTAAPLPRLALVDWFLPGKNGVEVAKKLVTASAQIAVVLMSGNEGVDRQAARAGAVALKKPFPVEDIVGLMGRVDARTAG